MQVTMYLNDKVTGEEKYNGVYSVEDAVEIGMNGLSNVSQVEKDIELRQARYYLGVERRYWVTADCLLIRIGD
jgi:hypothetical protein